MLEVTFIIEKGCPYAEYEMTKKFQSRYEFDLYKFNSGNDMEVVSIKYV